MPTTLESPGPTVFQEYADNRGVTLRVDRDKGIIPGVKLAGDREPQGPRVPQGGHGQGPAAVRRHAGQRRSRRPGPAAEPAGPHRAGQERDPQGRRPVRRLPFQPQTRPGRADRLGRGKRPAESRLLARHPRHQPQPRRQGRRRVDRPGPLRGPGGQSRHHHRAL